MSLTRNHPLLWALWIAVLLALCAMRSYGYPTIDDHIREIVRQELAGAAPTGPPGPTGPTGPTGPVEPPPDPPPPGDGDCSIPNADIQPFQVKPAGGAWDGWCYKKQHGTSDSKLREGGPDGSRGVAYNGFAAKGLGYGNRVGIEADIMLPLSWLGTGGYHIGGTNSCPSEGGTSCIRLDWNSPNERGFRMTIYTREGTPRCDWTVDNPVFFADTWTHVKWEVEYDPGRGKLTGFMEYTVNGVTQRKTRDCDCPDDISMPIGRYAKWSSPVSLPSDHPARRATLWIKNDRYYEH